MFPESVIELGDDEREWGMNATVYADHMFRSRCVYIHGMHKVIGRVSLRQLAGLGTD